MRFVFSMDMPSSQGPMVHQVIADHPAKSIEELCDALKRNNFIVVTQFYKDDTKGSEVIWTDRGPIILNTDIIGKVSLLTDRKSYDNSHGNPKFSRNDFEGKGRPVRPGRRVF